MNRCVCKERQFRWAARKMQLLKRTRVIRLNKPAELRDVSDAGMNGRGVGCSGEEGVEHPLSSLAQQGTVSPLQGETDSLSPKWGEVEFTSHQNGERSTKWGEGHLWRPQRSKTRQH